jgi:hypothetical protein
VDKGYQGASEKIRAIFPSKRNNLSREENARNKKIAKKMQEIRKLRRTESFVRTSMEE